MNDEYIYIYKRSVAMRLIREAGFDLEFTKRNPKHYPYQIFAFPKSEEILEAIIKLTGQEYDERNFDYD